MGAHLCPPKIRFYAGKYTKATFKPDAKNINFSQSSDVATFTPDAIIQGYKLCVLTKIY